MAKQGIWHIDIDTGGTFTDCVAHAPQGETHRLKVLSSGSLRGRIIRKIDPYNYSFEAPWQHESALLEGYTLRIAARDVSTKLLAIDYRNHILTLEENIPALSNIDFDLTSEEEAPCAGDQAGDQNQTRFAFPPKSSFGSAPRKAPTRFWRKRARKVCWSSRRVSRIC